MLNSNQIRKKFLEFFASKGHTIIDSDSLVPQNDPSVLFTSAGMNQFKEQFMGKITGYRRASSCQKCLRTADLVNVGKSPTHHTFFEMLGNFSFGDYFKAEAIRWAWEFITGVLKLPPEKLWISVHTSDQEAYEIWLNTVGIPADRIVRLGDRDNFWPANAPTDGPNGPCGPCSEIFYDWGKEYGCQKPECSPACDCKRFSEIWNLVFTQYDRQSDGRLAALPSKNIDTGMGLERITSVMQNVRENYATDLFIPILESLKSELANTGIVPPAAWMASPAKAIADHIRAAVVSIGDGVIPSNETRGYVIRKLIRRSIIHLKNVGGAHPLCYKLVYTIAETLQEPYPDLKRRHETIAGIIKKEEEMFWTILRERAPHNEAAFKALAENPASLGEQLYDSLVRKAGISEASALAFVQYDTYGVPLEISKENAQKFGLRVDDDEVEKAMELQRSQSRSKSQLAGEIFAKTTGQLVHGMRTSFIGYEQLECTATVQALLKGNELVGSGGAGEEIDIILDTTPFYAESGGQAGDRGLFSGDAGVEAEVIDTVKVDEVIIHRTKILRGSITKGIRLYGRVNPDLRSATARNHTATHLLQSALRAILGGHVEQSGSAVSEEKLRFDFSHLSALPAQTLQSVEQKVNQCIWANTPVQTAVMNIDEAKACGALAFFGEKYGSTVRVLSIGDYSREFCGGTHVRATGEIGLFKIITEYSVAQGIRRIEAVTGAAALALVQEREQLIAQASELLKTSPAALLDTIKKNVSQVKDQEKDLKKLRAGSVSSTADTVLEQSRDIGGVFVAVADMRDYSMEELRALSDAIRGKKDPVVCVLAATAAPKPLLIVSLSASLVRRGVDAVKIIREIAALAGGSGGGRKELAQAGAKDATALLQALEQTMTVVEKFLKN